MQAQPGRDPTLKYPSSRDDYELLYEIGSGATAVVYIAKVKPLNKIVAVKIIDLDQISTSTGQLEDFRHEIQIMKQTRHPNLVSYYVSFVVENYLWIVMRLLNVGSILEIMKILEVEQRVGLKTPEPVNLSGPSNAISASTSASTSPTAPPLAAAGLLHNPNTAASAASGGSLATLNGGPASADNHLKTPLLDECSIATILKSVLLALEYFHSQNLVHRDIKAGNILLDTDGTVQVADFGVSASLLIEGFRKNRTTFVGTPCWMAPEVMEQGSSSCDDADLQGGTPSIDLHGINHNGPPDSSHQNENRPLAGAEEVSGGRADGSGDLASSAATQNLLDHPPSLGTDDSKPDPMAAGAAASAPTNSDPPQYSGYGTKADIWSFGILCLELATGYAPYAKYPAMKVIMLTLTNPSPTLDLSVYDYSKTFKRMIDLCLQKDPNRRPTASELLKSEFIRSKAKNHEHLKDNLIMKVKPLTIRAHLNMLEAKKRHQGQQAQGGPNDPFDFSDMASSSDSSSSAAAAAAAAVTVPSTVLQAADRAVEQRQSIDDDGQSHAPRNRLFLFRNHKPSAYHKSQPGTDDAYENMCLYDLNATVHFKLRLKDKQGQLKDIIFPFNSDEDTPDRIAEELLENALISAHDCQITAEAINAFMSCMPAPRLILDEDSAETAQDSIRFPIHQYPTDVDAHGNKVAPTPDLNMLVGFAQLSLAHPPPADP